MKARKGQINYLSELIKYETMNCAVEWGIVLGIVILSKILSGSFLNFGTIIAVIVALLALKDSLILSIKIPYKSMDPENALKLRELNKHITILYNPLMSSSEKIMGIDAIAISGTTVLICVTNPKTDLKFTESFIKAIIARRSIESLNLKSYIDSKSFIDRVEGLHNMAKVTKQPISIEEKKIRGAILKFTI